MTSAPEQAEQARRLLDPIVLTEDRLADERARRAEASAGVQAEPIAPPPAPEREPTVRPEEPPEPAAPPARRRRTTALLVPVMVLLAVAGFAVGGGWHRLIGSRAATPPPVPPTPTRLGTAASSLPAQPVTTQAQRQPPSTSTPRRATTSVSTRTQPATTAAGHSTPPPGTIAKTTKTTARTTLPATTPPSKTTTRSDFSPSRSFAWPASANARFYSITFTRNGVKVFDSTVTAPRITLPSSFAFKPGRYRWIVLPAFGTKARPRYGPAVVDSQFTVKA